MKREVKQVEELHRLDLIMKEAWTLYPESKSIPQKTAILNLLFNVVKTHYTIVTLRFDEVYYQKQLEKLKKAIYEKRKYP